MTQDETAPAVSDMGELNSNAGPTTSQDPIPNSNVGTTLSPCQQDRADVVVAEPG